MQKMERGLLRVLKPFLERRVSLSLGPIAPAVTQPSFSSFSVPTTIVLATTMMTAKIGWVGLVRRARLKARPPMQNH